MPGKRTWMGLLLATGTLGLSIPAGASGAVTLGSDLATEPDGTTTCSSGMSDRGCLAVDDVLPGAALVAPSDGVIVRWRVRLGADTATQQIRIRTLSRLDPDQFTAIATGDLEDIPTGAGTYTFSARLPISRGDQVGLEADSGTAIEWRAPLAGGRTFEYGSPPPADGADTPVPTFINNDQEHTFNADVEPDADGDGYGDETQDECPTDPGTQEPCPTEPPDTDPPETEITKGAPNKLDKSKVKFKFTADEPNVTFECKIDKKPYKPCTSPRKVKRLDDGKHKFKVIATDEAGNTDPSAAKDKFKVVD